MSASTAKCTRYVSLAAVLVAALVSPALALHRESPGAVRLTTGGSHSVSFGRSWNYQVAFSSDQDLLNTGTTGRQVYVFSLFNYDCQKGLVRPDVLIPTNPCPNPPEPYLKRLTSGPGNPDNPSIDLSGSVLAFDADGTFNGNTGLVASHRQIYIINLLTGEVIQVTRATDGDSVRPTLSAGGGVCVFESTSPLKGGRSGVKQIFAFVKGSVQNVPTTMIVQITNGRGPSTYPMTNYGGGKISFESTADLLGDGHDTGVSQIWVAALDRTVFPWTRTLTQITKGNAPSHHPWMSEFLGFVLFDSQATDLPGASAPGGTQIYSAKADAGNRPPVQQYTSQNPFGDCTYPTLETSDNRFGFLCTGDPLQNGSSGNRVFFWDTQTSTVFQITSRGNVTGPISASVGHNFVTVADDTDLSGGQACGNQLYLVDYFPFLGHYIPAQAPGEMPMDAAQPGPSTTPQSSTFGARAFVMAPEDGNGSGTVATVVTQSGTTEVPLGSRFGEVTKGQSAGSLQLDIAPRDPQGQARVTVQSDIVTLPPVPIDGFGIACLRPGGDGTGILDCVGTRNGGDLVMTQNHNLGAADPGCATGCLENDPTPGPSCAGRLRGAHPSVCNGPLLTSRPGQFAPGGMQLQLPVLVSFATNAGLDGEFCSSDDDYLLQDRPAMLNLTTGTATGQILNAGNTLDTTLSESDFGAPFDCDRLQGGDLAGATLVGSLLFLDMPNQGPVTDLVLGLRLVAVGETCSDCVCTAGPCVTDADCNDGNVCTGTETCVNHTCVPGTSVSCDDGDPCTDDRCDAVSGCVHTNNTAPCSDGNPCTAGDQCQNDACVPGGAAANGTSCEDGNLCTSGDTCQAGTCVGGTPGPNGISCNDHNPCTVNESCQSGVCAGTPVADGTSCADTNVCNGAETCVGGGCMPGVALGCDDGNPCTDDGCDATAGCQHTPASGTICDDGNLCTQSDLCQNGVCTGGNPVTCTALDACHAAGTCDPGTGVCSNPALPDGSTCVDSDLCTGPDTCQAGTCVGGPAIVCAPLDQCHDAGVCDPGTGCSNPPKLDGTPCDDASACTVGDQCQAGTCTGATVVSCDNGDPCDGVESCDPGTGTCLPGTQLVCDDGNTCTDDSCVPGVGCSFVALPDATPCDDQQLCTLGDSCTAGVCGGIPTPCDDGNYCDGVETCDPQTGVCVPGTSLACNDSNPCTTDSCDPEAGCVFTPLLDGTPCDDGDACTVNDHCDALFCTGIARVCDDGNICNGIETCDPTLGCETSTPPTCADQNPCTQDECDPVLGCTFTPLPDGSSCNDGNACTTLDHCEAGTCVSAPLACDDGNACNGVETCDPGVGCVSGTPVVCDDFDPCTDDTCIPTTGACVSTTSGDTYTCHITTLLASLTTLQQNVQTAPTASLGARRQARLAFLVGRSASRVQAALAASGRQRSIYLLRAQVKLRLFMHVLDLGMRQRKVDIPTGTTLRTEAATATTEVVALRAS